MMWVNRKILMIIVLPLGRIFIIKIYWKYIKSLYNLIALKYKVNRIERFLFTRKITHLGMWTFLVNLRPCNESTHIRVRFLFFLLYKNEKTACSSIIVYFPLRVIWCGLSVILFHIFNYNYNKLVCKDYNTNTSTNFFMLRWLCIWFSYEEW